MLTMVTTMNWDERSPPDDGEMEARSGSLEPAGALATMKIENASFEMQSAARNFVDARKLVALVTSTRGFFPPVGVGAFDGLQSMAPRASRWYGSFRQRRGSFCV